MFAVGAKLLAFACVLACVVAGGGVLWILVPSALGYAGLLVQRKWRLAASFLVFQLLLGTLLYAIVNFGLHMPLFSEFNVLLFWNLYPVFIVAWDLITTPPGELSAFLSRCRLPNYAILGLLVVFRFFPTMKTELGAIVQSMRNRGLMRASHMLAHPVATGEYVLVPLLLRILQVADQLTVSAIARGAERPGLRFGYFGKKLGASDAAWVLSWLACLVGTLALKWGAA